MNADTPCPTMPPHLMLRCGRVGKEPAQRLPPRARPGELLGHEGGTALVETAK